MPFEIWDVYDRYGNCQNRTVKRGDCLQDEDYHLLVQIWIKNSEGEYLIQKRANTVKDHPGQWATTAGHVLSGENSLDGATRELFEELGIQVIPDDLRQVHQVLYKKAIAHVWFLERNIDDDEISIQPEEVSETMWATPQWILNQVKKGQFFNYGSEYFDKLFSIKAWIG